MFSAEFQEATQRKEYTVFFSMPLLQPPEYSRICVGFMAALHGNEPLTWFKPLTYMTVTVNMLRWVSGGIIVVKDGVEYQLNANLITFRGRLDRENQVQITMPEWYARQQGLV